MISEKITVFDEDNHVTELECHLNDDNKCFISIQDVDPDYVGRWIVLDEISDIDWLIRRLLDVKKQMKDAQTT